jgi:hypothetical protein
MRIGAGRVEVRLPDPVAWRDCTAGLKADDAKRLKELQAGNSRLKRLLAEAELRRRLTPFGWLEPVEADDGAR